MRNFTWLCVPSTYPEAVLPKPLEVAPNEMYTACAGSSAHTCTPVAFVPTDLVGLKLIVTLVWLACWLA